MSLSCSSMHDEVYLTPWGCLTLSELDELAWKANDAGDLEERDEIWSLIDARRETMAR